MKIQPQYVKLPHIGHNWRFLKESKIDRGSKSVDLIQYQENHDLHKYTKLYGYDIPINHPSQQVQNIVDGMLEECIQQEQFDEILHRRAQSKLQEIENRRMASMTLSLKTKPDNRLLKEQQQKLKQIQQNETVMTKVVSRQDHYNMRRSISMKKEHLSFNHVSTSNNLFVYKWLVEFNFDYNQQ